MKGSTSLEKLCGWVAFAVLAAGRLSAGDIVINEIHYDPPDETKLEEFVELHNKGAVEIDLSGWYFSEGIEYVIPDGTRIAPGGYLVVAESPDRIRSAFGIGGVVGPFSGHLANDGERIVLRNSAGEKEDDVDYKVAFPWPLDSAGRGSSLELLDPSLENDLGGSWRPSGGSKDLPVDRQMILPAGDDAWHYRKGTSEASDPRDAWRAAEFVEDGTWLVGKTSVGFADDDDATVLDDMLGNYTSVYFRHVFELPAGGDLPLYVKVRVYVDDGAVLFLNGVEVARTHLSAGEKAYGDVGRSNEAKWEEFLVGGTRGILRHGTNILAAHAFNVSISNNDFSFDAELVVPARGELPPAPTPGAENSVHGDPMPPQLRQVDHAPKSPGSSVPIVVTVKATDPDGVASVSLRYQVVAPGSYIPSHLALEPSELMAAPDKPRPPNPAFEDPASWRELEMADDGKAPDAVAGDSIYSAAIPGQENRTIVRYRITATDRTGASVTAPYPDDKSLNFACWIYDGLPSYTTTKLTVHPEGVGYTYPPEALSTVPIYTVVARNSELQRMIAYNGSWQIPKSNEKARDAFNWEGAFVYEGKVHDHIHFRLHQANDRYGGGGKRSWRIRFNKGSYLQAKDDYGREYPTKWRTINTGKMFDNKGVGNFGLTETMNENLWNSVGVAAPYVHTFHFRVVDGPEEAPAGQLGQYSGDFWGMALAFEDYDPRFLDAHGLPDGNLYKLKDGIFDGNQLKRNQGRYAVTSDADFQNIRMKLRPDKDAAWLDSHVRYEKWYSYHTVVEAIRHYDFVPADSHSKNRAWYFEPAEGAEFGLLWTLPWDADASWGPNWNDGIDYSYQAIFGPPAEPDFKREYRNVLREFRDLFWVEETINPMIDDLAALVTELAKADRDRWRQSPVTEGAQDFGTMEAKVADMKKFAFTGWTGGTGPTVPAGGRAKYLENLASAEGEATQIPLTPTASYAGSPGFPIDDLVFEASPFADPQPADTLAAARWRAAEVSNPTVIDPTRPRVIEWNAVWDSGILTDPPARTQVPAGTLIPGRTYRVRVKYEDSTGRWSHWSAPVEFISSPPKTPIPEVAYLRVTEIMYNPAEAGDLEFLEVMNTGDGPLDLMRVHFTEGIRFDFAGSDVTSLAPGARAVVVKNLGLFTELYGPGVRVAGEYSGKLDNEGDQIVLAFGDSIEIQRFTYDDSWYPDTDGEGYSLVIANPKGPLTLWNEKAGWARGKDVDGSPGRADDEEPPRGGYQVPGDVAQDGALNITDAVAILGHLFRGEPSALPCEGGTFESAGNRALADVNGDGELNLTDAVHLLRFLFQGSAPPALGTACMPMPGCPDVCLP